MPNPKKVTKSMKKILKEFFIEESLSVREAMKQMGKTGKKILFVVDENKQLIGSLSDGDIRRWVLKESDLRKAIRNAYNKKPMTITPGYDIDHVKELMLVQRIEAIPVVSPDAVIEDILFWDTVFGKDKRTYSAKLSIPVVIMAGGKGTRLDPFTKVLPKPLIPLGEKTIIEMIMEKFARYGVNEFHLSINHKAQMIKAYLKEVNLPYKIHLVEESKPLGTAGSLRLLKNKIKGSLFVSNCDIIIETDYSDLENYHKQNANDITIVGSFRHFTIPYGVCDMEHGGQLVGINEKPEFDFLVNTGMYILNKKVLSLIPANESYNMTDLITDVKAQGGKVGIFPIDEKSWMDVGHLEEYRRAVSLLERV
jgi:dTDP-glucose pyrophosphorylase